MKTWKIYKHTLLVDCPSKGKSYIGLTGQAVEKRWQKGKGYPTKGLFGKALKKYGWDNFSHEIIEDNIKTVEEANTREMYWIAYYNTCIYAENSWGYNTTFGGSATGTYSEETCKKISASKLGKHLYNNGKIEKYFSTTDIIPSEFKPGQLYRSPEQYKKSGEKNRGRKMSAAQRQLMREVNLGNKISLGRITIHNETTEKHVKPEELDAYLAMGYIKGKPPKQKN